MRICKAFLLLALVLASTTSGRSADLPTVRVVTVPIEGAADVYYAADHGFFRNAGLDVQIDTIAAGQNIVVGVSGGSYDAGISTTIAIALAHERGVPIRIISGATMHVSAATTDLLMVAQDSPYRSARDLNGKTVAVTGLGNVPYLATQLWLRKNGATVSTVKFVELPYPAMPAALETGARRRCHDGSALHHDLEELRTRARERVRRDRTALSPRWLVLVGCLDPATSRRCSTLR